MKVPFSWLKDYVEIDITAQELQDKLFSCGFEVEELTYLGKDVTNVVYSIYGNGIVVICIAWVRIRGNK